MRFSQRFPVRSAAMKQLRDFKCKDTKFFCGFQIFRVKITFYFQLLKET